MDVMPMTGRPRVRRSKNDASVASLIEELKHAVDEGKYAAHSLFPSERQLCEQYGVVRRVAHRAMECLEQEGIVYRRARSGTFVRGPVGGPELQSRLRTVTFVEDRWPMPDNLRFNLREYLAAYTATFDGTGIQMRFVPSPGDDRGFEHYFLDTVPLQEQACILVNVTPSAFMKWMQEHRVSYVVQHYTEYPCDGLPEHHSVIVNKFRGAFEMVRHLLDLGHRRIGFMGPLDSNDLNGAVYRGYCAGMEWAGLMPGSEDLVNLATDDVEATVGPAMKFLDRKDRPTALFLQTDAMAQGVLTAAHRLGIRVPEELSVAGYDDSPGADATDPPLTTVASPRYRLAHTAAEMLLAIAKGGFQSWQQRVLDCRLVVRKSTAAPGGASTEQRQGPRA